MNFFSAFFCLFFLFSFAAATIAFFLRKGYNDANEKEMRKPFVTSIFRHLIPYAGDVCLYGDRVYPE